MIQIRDGIRKPYSLEPNFPQKLVVTKVICTKDSNSNLRIFSILLQANCKLCSEWLYISEYVRKPNKTNNRSNKHKHKHTTFDIAHHMKD